MIHHQILTDDAIAIVEPGGPLSEEDFSALAESVDAYLETHDALDGLLIHVKEFPGWESLGGMVSHFKFVKNHHERIRRVAFVSDSKVATLAPKFATHFVSAEVKSFGYDDYDEALAWLRSE